MKIEVKKTITHGEFAKYMVDKFGIASFERNLAGGEWFGATSDIYSASINLKPSKYDDFLHSISINENSVTLKTFEEITEDTVIPKLVVNHSDTGFTLYKNEYINNEFPLDSVRAFYILNDDLTMTLIWRDGKLVE